MSEGGLELLLPELRGTAEFVGDCLVVHVVPFQWDSRTGACNFPARWDGANLGTRSFRYDGTGLFRAPSSVCTDDLDGADQDDLLKVWVEVVGTYSYDTAAGGTNAVPEFTIVKAVLVSKGMRPLLTGRLDGRQRGSRNVPAGLACACHCVCMSQSRSQPNEGRRPRLAEDGIIVPATRPRRLPAEKVKLSSGLSIVELIDEERR